jgi:hypothetical protein
MKRFFLLALCCLAALPCVKAQEGSNFQAGAFVDYFRSGATGTNMFGLGGRAGVKLVPHVMIEGEVAYDFNRGFNNNFFNSDNTGSSYITSGVKTLHGLFGPKITLDHGPIHPFVEAKFGFVDYSFNNLPTGNDSVSNPIQNLRNQNINAALFLGGGLEAKVFGPVGVRFDVGDEMYFNSGAQHGLKATFGPIIRF